MATADEGRGKNKIVAAVLGICLGTLGIHHFYLGSNTAGIILLVATVVTCGFGGMITWIVGLVEGILLIMMSDEEFDAKYNARQPEPMEFVFQKK